MIPSTVLEKFLHWEKETPDNLFLRQPFGDEWKTWTYKQAGDEIRRVAQAIKKLGFPVGTKIATLSKNCAHWVMADLAIIMNGHVSVPLYATLTARSIQEILEHSESKAIIIGKLDHYDEQREGIPTSLIRIGIGLYGIPETNSWENCLKNESPLSEFYSWKKDDLLTIIYTSGTTGTPKGVMHNVQAFDTTVQTAVVDLGIKLHPKLFSFLPLSHIAERMGIEMLGIYQGAQFSFSESLEVFPKNLADTQPDIFFAVPRLWGKFQEKILVQLPQKRLSLLLSIPIVNSIIRKKIKAKLGLSRATHVYSGAAPISIDVLKWFERLGVVIYQAYGMTEDCVYSHFNRAGANKHGTVGQRLTGVQVKIAEDGEIRLKSTGNMMGYYKEPNMTTDAFDEENFFKTGDRGEVDAQGFLKITGRAKDNFKTDKGKYIAPAPIETKLLVNSDIEQVCVVGMGIPQPIALIILSAYASKKPKDEIIRSLSDSLNEVNATLENYEKLEKSVIMKEEWTIENGLMTPKLSVKRYAVEKIHVPTYPTWYGRPGKVIWE
jgi:long-chain acyl-CoA synthetase